MLRLLLLLSLPIVFAAGPLSAQTQQLSTRTFWIGAPMHAFEDWDPFIAPRRIDWMEAIIERDPILSRAVIHIEDTFVPAGPFIASMHEDEILLGSDRLPPSYILEDYLIYGPKVPTSTSFTYVPVDPDDGFVVSCGQTIDRSRLSLCVVLATYPPDDFVRLKARLYFPSDPAERPTFFRDVARRMRELAYCLDVTEREVDVREEYPTLSGCGPSEQ